MLGGAISKQQTTISAIFSVLVALCRDFFQHFDGESTVFPFFPAKPSTFPELLPIIIRMSEVVPCGDVVVPADKLLLGVGVSPQMAAPSAFKRMENKVLNK